MKKADIRAYAAATILFILIFVQCKDKGAANIPQEKPNDKLVVAAFPVSDSTRELFHVLRSVRWAWDTTATNSVKFKSDTVWGVPTKDTTGKTVYMPVVDSLILWDINLKNVDEIFKIKK